MSSTKLNAEKTVAIDKGYHWRKVNNDTPIGVKLQLINKDAGVAFYGTLTSQTRRMLAECELLAHQKANFATHWAPLPTFPKDDHEA